MKFRMKMPANDELGKMLAEGVLNLFKVMSHHFFRPSTSLIDCTHPAKLSHWVSPAFRPFVDPDVDPCAIRVAVHSNYSAHVASVLTSYTTTWWLVTSSSHTGTCLPNYMSRPWGPSSWYSSIASWSCYWRGFTLQLFRNSNSLMNWISLPPGDACSWQVLSKDSPRLINFTSIRNEFRPMKHLLGVCYTSISFSVCSSVFWCSFTNLAFRSIMAKLHTRALSI
jgi:hypothetical protein